MTAIAQSQLLRTIPGVLSLDPGVVVRAWAWARGEVAGGAGDKVSS